MTFTTLGLLSFWEFLEMTDRNSQLQKIIEQNPGIQFREIMRFSGLKNGVLSHYLGKLEKMELSKYNEDLDKQDSILQKSQRQNPQ